MRRFRFGIRTVLLLAAIVAFSMLIIPPGKWFIEVTSTDPLLGKRTLISREVVLLQLEEIRLELRKAK